MLVHRTLTDEQPLGDGGVAQALRPHAEPAATGPWARHWPRSGRAWLNPYAALHELVRLILRSDQAFVTLAAPMAERELVERPPGLTSRQRPTLLAMVSTPLRGS